MIFIPFESLDVRCLRTFYYVFYEFFYVLDLGAAPCLNMRYNYHYYKFFYQAPKHVVD